MGVIQLCVILAVIGVLLYCFNRYVTFIDGNVKKIINFVVLAACVLIVLYAFGILPFHDVAVPRLH